VIKVSVPQNNIWVWIFNGIRKALFAKNDTIRSFAYFYDTVSKSSFETNDKFTIFFVRSFKNPTAITKIPGQ